MHGVEEGQGDREVAHKERQEYDDPEIDKARMNETEEPVDIFLAANMPAAAEEAHIDLDAVGVVNAVDTVDLRLAAEQYIV